MYITLHLSFTLVIEIFDIGSNMRIENQKKSLLCLSSPSPVDKNSLDGTNCPGDRTAIGLLIDTTGPGIRVFTPHVRIT